MMAFELDPQLKKDTHYLGEFDLCQVLLMNDCQYPWIILVPKREKVREIFELSEQDQLQLMLESNFMLEEMSRVFKADKMNVANLGNIVSQLHIHHIARYTNDASWPGPVWGVKSPQAYSDDKLKKAFQTIKEMLNN